MMAEEGQDPAWHGHNLLPTMRSEDVISLFNNLWIWHGNAMVSVAKDHVNKDMFFGRWEILFWRIECTHGPVSYSMAMHGVGVDTVCYGMTCERLLYGYD